MLLYFYVIVNVVFYGRNEGALKKLRDKQS